MCNGERFEELLLKQYALYPKMQLSDMVKFIYQNEFAGGHFITDEESSLERLKEECLSLGHSLDSYVQRTFGFERIGNGLCRLHLVPFADLPISPVTINRFFIHTANSVQGTVLNFEAKLNMLRRVCQKHVLPFSLVELDRYLHDYKKCGYPSVSHSLSFKRAYSPAYRVVYCTYSEHLELFSQIDEALKTKETVSLPVTEYLISVIDLLRTVYRCHFQENKCFISVLR